MSRLTKSISFFILVAYLLAGFISPVLAVTANPYENLPMASAALHAKTGKLLAGKNQNVVLPLASLTKLMTALVLIDRKLNFNKKVMITKAEVGYTTPFIAQGDITSKIDLQSGDKVTVDNLWHAMLIASSNEAAIALVDNSGLTRSQFVKKMNSKAKALGLRKTVFTEPSGIDPKNVGTAKEMAVIAKQAYAYLSVRKASAMPGYAFKELSDGRKINIVSRNNSLLAMKPMGMKVGYLEEAKMNAALRLKKSGNDRIVVILHAVNNARRNSEINRLMAK